MKMKIFFDDDEHGAGDYLLRFLVKEGITSRVVFVVRDYDGTHIGERRFKAMEDAVKLAILQAPMNDVNGQNDYKWGPGAQDYGEQRETPMRGGYSGARGALHQSIYRANRDSVNGEVAETGFPQINEPQKDNQGKIDDWAAAEDSVAVYNDSDWDVRGPEAQERLNIMI